MTFGGKFKVDAVSLRTGVEFPVYNWEVILPPHSTLPVSVEMRIKAVQRFFVVVDSSWLSGPLRFTVARREGQTPFEVQGSVYVPGRRTRATLVLVGQGNPQSFSRITRGGDDFDNLTVPFMLPDDFDPWDLDDCVAAIILSAGEVGSHAREQEKSKKAGDFPTGVTTVGEFSTTSVGGEAEKAIETVIGEGVERIEIFFGSSSLAKRLGLI